MPTRWQSERLLGSIIASQRHRELGCENGVRQLVIQNGYLPKRLVHFKASLEVVTPPTWQPRHIEIAGVLFVNKEAAWCRDTLNIWNKVPFFNVPMPPGPEFKYLYEHQQAKSTFQSCSLTGTLPTAWARSKPTTIPCSAYVRELIPGFVLFHKLTGVATHVFLGFLHNVFKWQVLSSRVLNAGQHNNCYGLIQIWLECCTSRYRKVRFAARWINL